MSAQVFLHPRMRAHQIDAFCERHAVTLTLHFTLETVRIIVDQFTDFPPQPPYPQERLQCQTHP